MAEKGETLSEDYMVTETFNNYFNSIFKALSIREKTELIYSHANNSLNVVLEVIGRYKNECNQE